MPDASDAPLADEPQPGAIPDDMPTGMPEDAHDTEERPLGPDGAEPEGTGDPQRGEDAMPGFPGEGEPPSAG